MVLLKYQRRQFGSDSFQCTSRSKIERLVARYLQLLRPHGSVWKPLNIWITNCRFFLILETLACPDLSPHETMKQGRALFQHEPLTAREINGTKSRITKYEKPAEEL